MYLIPDVSIIITAYNVGQYLQRCIESVIEQSLKSIEIILVDDGSTDKGKNICDEYAAKDYRIKVIHKENAGLSAARNDGIEAATAQYIMFIDGDDWVEPEFCKKPYQTALEYGADLVIFHSYSMKNHKIQRGYEEPYYGLIDAESAIKKGGNVAWNKLYKKELFDSYRYPVGKQYEDVATTYKIVCSAKRVVMIPDKLYCYVYREDSISHSISLKNKKDAFIFAKQQSEDLRSYGFREETYINTLYSCTLAFLANSYPNHDQLYKDAEEIADSIKGIPAGLVWKKKMMLAIWKINKSLFHLVCQKAGLKEQNEIYQ